MLKSCDLARAQELVLQRAKLLAVATRTMPKAGYDRKAGRVGAIKIGGEPDAVVYLREDEDKDVYDAVRAVLQRRVHRIEAELRSVGVIIADEPVMEEAA